MTNFHDAKVDHDRLLGMARSLFLEIQAGAVGARVKATQVRDILKALDAPASILDRKRPGEAEELLSSMQVLSDALFSKALSACIERTPDRPN